MSGQLLGHMGHAARASKNRTQLLNQPALMQGQRLIQIPQQRLRRRTIATQQFGMNPHQRGVGLLRAQKCKGAGNGSPNMQAIRIRKVSDHTRSLVELTELQTNPRPQILGRCLRKHDRSSGNKKQPRSRHSPRSNRSEIITASQAHRAG